MPEDATGCKCSSLPMLRPRHPLGPFRRGGDAVAGGGLRLVAHDAKAVSKRYKRSPGNAPPGPAGRLRVLVGHPRHGRFHAAQIRQAMSQEIGCGSLCAPLADALEPARASQRGLQELVTEQ